MLKVNVKIDYKEAKVEGYGIIRVRPLGAGEEIELSMLQDELAALQPSFEALSDTEETPENKEKLAELAAQTSRIINKCHELIARSVSSEDPKVAERLIKELPMIELSRIVTEILKNA